MAKVIMKEKEAEVVVPAGENLKVMQQMTSDVMSGKMQTTVQPTVTPQIKNSAERKTALNVAFKNIQKLHGEESVMRLGDKPLKAIDVVSTGCLSLDYALGVGGVPRGRIVEIFGPESSGKTTLCLQIAAQVHKLGGNVAFIDAEHGLDLKYAKNLGVNVDDLILSQPDNGEQALGIAEEWLKSGAMDLIIIDSVAALTPLSELEGEMGAPTMGVQARLMSQACRKLAAIIGKTNTIVIFTNQLRMKIGVMFGNPEVTTGGNALKFYSSVRLDVRRQDAIKVGEEIIGNKTRIKVVKNKVAPPFRETTVNVIYGAGIDIYNDVVSLGVFTGIIDKSGSWFAYRGDRLGQGADNAATFLKENPSIFTLLRNDIITKLFT